MFSALKRCLGKSVLGTGLARRQKLKRSLRCEHLEERRVFAILGIESMLTNPIIDYDNGGNASYDSISNHFRIDASPLDFTGVNGSGFFLSGSFDVNLFIDEFGNLISGAAGNDLVVTGELDTDFDFVPDFSGELLTGEVFQFGFQEQGSSDDFDFRFVVTGGALASLYSGMDLGVTLELENSTFSDNFSLDFGGSPAKGKLGGVMAVPEPTSFVVLLSLVGIGFSAYYAKRRITKKECDPAYGDSCWLAAPRSQAQAHWTE